MKQGVGILLFLVFTTSLTGCLNTSIPKPDELISRDKFIKLMVDVYLVQGLQGTSAEVEVVKKVTQSGLYYSVLNKHAVSDTVFIRSLIYYSSFPKDYEKMHAEILNVLNESQLQLKPQEKLNLEVK